MSADLIAFIVLWSGYVVLTVAYLSARHRSQIEDERACLEARMAYDEAQRRDEADQ